MPVLNSRSVSESIPRAMSLGHDRAERQPAFDATVVDDEAALEREAFGARVGDEHLGTEFDGAALPRFRLECVVQHERRCRARPAPGPQ